MKTVKISTQKPPQWILDEVKEKFNVNWEDNIIFTYGDLITSSRGEMGEDLMAHEPHHTKQQIKFGGKDKWWRKYLDDNEFRYSQELACYRKQYNWVQNNIKNRNEAFKYLLHYARALSGEMYGNIVSTDKAIKEIRNV